MSTETAETLKVYRVAGADGDGGGLICSGTEWGMGAPYGELPAPPEDERNRRRDEEVADFLADDAHGTGKVKSDDGTYYGAEPKGVSLLLMTGATETEGLGGVCLTRAEVRELSLKLLPALTAPGRLVMRCLEDDDTRAVYEEEMTADEIRNLPEFDGF